MSRNQEIISFSEWMESGGMKDVSHLPGEEDWASWKCGGGPHKTKEGIQHKTPPIGYYAINEVPYSGTETQIIIERPAEIVDPLQFGV